MNSGGYFTAEAAEVRRGIINALRTSAASAVNNLTFVGEVIGTDRRVTDLASGL